MSELSPPQEGPRKPAVETAESPSPLRALLLGPREEAEPLVEALRADGYEPVSELVDSREALLHALKPDAWDVAICQDGVPSLDGPAALRLIKGACPDLPVIILSSTFGESIAAAAMKAGADDFIARGFLARLVPAVEREVRAAKMRRGWQEAARGLADVRARSTLERLHGQQPCDRLDEGGVGSTRLYQPHFRGDLRPLPPVCGGPARCRLASARGCRGVAPSRRDRFRARPAAGVRGDASDRLLPTFSRARSAKSSTGHSR